MSKDLITSLQKLSAFKQNPELVKEPSILEMAEITVHVLSQVDKVIKAIEAGKIAGKTPQKDVEYLGKETAIGMIRQGIVNEIQSFEDRAESTISTLEQKGKELESQVSQSLAKLKNGTVTDEEIQRAASLALELLELPDFEELVSTSITSNSEAIRNALELLQGDERYQVELSDIRGLNERDSLLSDSLTKTAISIVDNRTSFLINKVNNLENSISSISSSGVTSILDYGATMDGSDDGPAIQASLDALGYAFVPEGTTTILTQVVMPSNSTIYGLGMGRSIIQPHASMARTTRMITTLGPSGGARRTENIVIRDITLDGSTRTWPTWSDSGWDDSGYLVYLAAVDGYHLDKIEVMNQPSFGVGDAGGKNGKVTGCHFHDNGNPHKFSPALYISSSGNTYSITDITNAVNAQITLKQNGAVTTGPTSMYISGVRSMALADGVYDVTYVSDNVFELTGAAGDTSGMAPFEVDLMAYVGISGNTGTAFVPNINPIVSGNHFSNNAFHHVSFVPTEGGNFENNILKTCGESAVFCENSRNVNFVGNKFEDTTVTAIVANGLELNRCANVTVLGNYFADTATTAMSMNNGQNIVIDGNTFNRSIKDNTVTFPVGPDYPTGGPAINLNSVIKIGSVGLIPGRSISVTNNTVMDLRETPQATSIINFVRSGTETYRIYDILIKNNNWLGSGVPADDMITYTQADAVDTTTVDLSGNLGYGGDISAFSITTSTDGTPASFTNTTDNASVVGQIIEGNRATPATNDEVYQSFKLSDSAGNQDEYARIICRGTAVTSGAEAGRITIATIQGGTLTNRVGIASGVFFPSTSNGMALGSATQQWSDLFLAEGGVINWDNGDATLTQVGDAVTLAGASLVARITPRTNSTTSAATLAPDLSTADVYFRTTQTVTLAVSAPIGTPVIGDRLTMYITAAGIQTINWNAVYVAYGAALPAATVAGKTLKVECQYDGTNWATTTSLQV